MRLVDAVAEWLRRWTANPMGSARVGSNPIGVAITFFELERFLNYVIILIILNLVQNGIDTSKFPHYIHIDFALKYFMSKKDISLSSFHVQKQLMPTYV